MEKYEELSFDLMKAELPHPLYMETQVARIVESLNDGGLEIDSSAILDIMRGISAVKIVNGEIETLPSNKHVDEIAKGEYATFSEGIELLLRTYNEKALDDIQPVKTVAISDMIFGEATPNIWYDITRFYAHLCRKITRYNKLNDLKCPYIILLIEERLLWEYLQRLDTNRLYNNKELSDKRANGTICRALYDIGYTLADGWNDTKKEQFRKEYEEFEEFCKREENAG